MCLWLFFKGYYIVLIGEILLAISKVMLDNVTSGYLYDYLKEKNQQNKMVKYYGYTNFCLSLGTVVASLFGTYIYTKFGFKTIFILELLLISTSIILFTQLPKINSCKKDVSLQHKLKEFYNKSIYFYKRKEIRYFVFYSGLLTSYSILFALSFQHIMQNALFPVFLFGIVAFLNHGIRAIASVIANKISTFLKINQMIIPLFILYLFAFLCIFIVLKNTNTILVLSLIFIICLIIGFQLIFTICHVSRLHRLIDSCDRGKIMMFNNLYSKILVSIVLISNIFIAKLGFTNYYIIAFILLFIVGLYIANKVLTINEDIV